MQRLTGRPRPQMSQGKANVQRHWKQFAALLALALLLLAGCGRAEQQAEQPSPAPLSPAPATPEDATPTSATQGTPALIRPTPNETQGIATVTVAFLKTSIAASRNEDRATATAKAEWAQTPEPTILPPADGPRLRDLWPAANQQAAAPTRLYLRNSGRDGRESDSFWEVQLPDGHLRRLPAVETPGIDKSAQLSPDGRFLAYLTGNAKTQERTLHLLDLAQESDRVLASFMTASRPGCLRSFAWSPGGRSLALITLEKTSRSFFLKLFDDVASSQPPRTLVELSEPQLRLISWLDSDHLLFWHWKGHMPAAQLLSVDRQGRSIPVAELPLDSLSCTSLSPDRQDLLYNDQNQLKRLHISTGQQNTLPWMPPDLNTSQAGRYPVSPHELFWIGDDRRVLFSRFGTRRQVWLYALDQPQPQAGQQTGVFLSPPYQAPYQFGIIGMSPDGQTLVACEQPSTDNPRIRTRQSRTWLYSVPNDHWTLLDIQQDISCTLVMGWSSVGGAQ